MSSVPRSVTWRVLLRSLLVQGSWNYETLIGTGFAFAVVPVLRALYPTDPDGFRAAVARHAEVFNSHPYLATVAIGAVSRLEADGVDPRVIVRFKSALRGSLGSVGDQVVWHAWRPASAMLGVFLIVAGAAWWVGVAAFLVVYNTLHLWLRWWGWRIGTASGLEVGRILREAPLQAISLRASQLGAMFAGATLTLVIVDDPGTREVGRALMYAVAVGAGVWLGGRARHVLASVLAIVLILGIVTGLLG